ncbi:MAG: prephenate dehydrogenase [Burkholderiaceae bacterium]
MIERLLVVGTGLMGGSVAAAARAHGWARAIWGVDPVHAQAAVDLGLVDRGFVSLAQALEAIGQAHSAAQLQTAVVLAAPVSVLPSLLGPLADHHLQYPWAWLTEIGSTKGPVVEGMDRLLADASRSEETRMFFARAFVPSHPMAGAEHNGPQAAHADLFRRARVLISPLASSGEEAVAEVEAFWAGLGAIPSQLPIQDHDPLLAAISHFPHLLAYGLAGMLATSASATAAQSLYGGGLRDTTRIAASSAELWADILLQNRQSVLDLIPQWNLSFVEITQALDTQDRQALVAALDRGAQWRRGFR